MQLCARAIRPHSAHRVICTDIGLPQYIPILPVVPQTAYVVPESSHELSTDVRHAHMPDDTPAQRILVVDDEPAVRTLAERMLKKLGYSVTPASNGKEALSLIIRGDLFDLLFTDVMMPGGMNGWQLSEEARKVDHRIKVLFTSGYSAFAFKHLDREEQKNLKIIRKPYRLVELKEAV